MVNIFRNLDWTVLLDLALSVIPILICITVHECCHGLCALALGDDTAKRAGRLSLNPIKHFDAVGFIMMLVLAFAPQNVNVKNFARSFLLWILLASLFAVIVVVIITAVTGVGIMGLIGAYNEAVSSSQMYY